MGAKTNYFRTDLTLKPNTTEMLTIMTANPTATPAVAITTADLDTFFVSLLPKSL
jgi:hypothetical protein